MTSVFPINFNTTYRKQGEGDEELSPPSGLCFTREGNILLADDFNHRIQVYDPNFNLITSFGEKGKNIGQLQYPKGIAVDKEGNIFVADSWNHRVQKFDSQGKPLQSFGTCGDKKGELNEPYDILLDSSGILIVVERYNHRIQFFDKNGKSLGWVGQRGTTLEEKLADLYETPLNLIAPPLFEFPTSIAQDSCGNFFITDSGNHRIQKFNNQWKKILTFGGPGNEPGQFQYPLCITTAINDLLYIADLNNNKIQIFTCFGHYLSSIDGTDMPLEAPCLTLVDNAGNLFIGSTFDTKIDKYQVSTEEENILSENLSKQDPVCPEFVNYYSLVQEKHKNEAKAFAALEKALELLGHSNNNLSPQSPIRLGRLAFSGSKITESSLSLAISFLEKQLDESRKEMLSMFEVWQEKAKQFDEERIKEHGLIQKDPQGLRDFNHDLYSFEQEYNKFFRETRSKFNTFRKTSQQLYDFIFHFSESEASDSQKENLTKCMARQWEASINIIKNYFDQKEKSEESMVKILGDEGSDQLPAFLIKYYHNCRTIDLLLQLQFPLRAHCQIIKILSRQAVNDEKIEGLVSKLTSKSVFAENAIKIMIRFHEKWEILENLEPQFLETMDAALPYLSNEDINILEPGIDDFLPIAFDSENLDIEKISQCIQAQGAEIKYKNGILSWGPIQYKTDSLTNKKDDLISKVLAILEAQSVFQDKTEELLIQLDNLGQQRRDLDAQLRQVGTEDKTTPIIIYNNIAITDFQLNLMRRMIKGIEINENLNLHRLIIGTAIVKILSPTQEDSKLFDALKDYFEKIEKQIQEISIERKSKNFELLGYREKQKQLASSFQVSDIDESIKVEANISEYQAKIERLELKFKRIAKIKSLLNLILNFAEANPSKPQTPLKQVFSFGKAGPEIGLPLTPQGLTYNNKGDLLVADYEGHCIYCYTSDGKYKFHFGSWGNTATSFKYPANLATDSQNNIYVIDEGNGVIKKFDQMGNFILQFQEGVLGCVFSLSIDSQDRVHVADPDNNRITVFDSMGKEISQSFTTEQSKNLNGPCGVFCLKNGGTLVGDRSESLLKHFDAEGKLIKKINKEDLGFDDIYFLACDPQHGIYGSDFWHSQIIHLNSDLDVVDVYRNQGIRTGELGKTGGLSIHNGRLAAASFDGRRVQIFDLPT